MQAQHQLMTSTGQMLITAAVVASLAVMAMVPAVGATSLVPVKDLVTEESSAQSSGTNIEVIRDQIQFLEDNWHFGPNDRVADDEDSDNPAATVRSLSAEDRVDQINELRSQNVADFEAMERAPGIYTDSPGSASLAGNASVYAGLSRDDVKFLRDNWHLGPGIFIQDEDGAGAAAGNPALTRDQIQFLEDNWHLDAGILLPDQVATEDVATTRALIRNEILFNEDNWKFRTGETLSGNDMDDTSSDLTSGNNVGRSHDELTYPWGGYLEHDY